jgi:hypothetical protein
MVKIELILAIFERRDLTAYPKLDVASLIGLK